MAHMTHPIDDVNGHLRAAKGHAKRAAHEVSPWIELLARAGYAAKGVVYSLVGVFALLAARGSGDAKGSRTALGELLDKPYGQVLLGVIAIGLAGYALWCFVRALVNPEHDKTGSRVFSFVKGVGHVVLVIAVIGMITGSRSQGGGGGGGDWTGRLMEWPAGKWLVMAIGLGIVGYGIFQLYRAWTADLDDQLSLGRMNPQTARTVRYVSRFGMAARGVVFLVVGGFAFFAGLRSSPSEAKGVGEALQYLRTQPYGPWLLGFVALGLIGYGIYEFVRARYRHIKPA